MSRHDSSNDRRLYWQYPPALLDDCGPPVAPPPSYQQSSAPCATHPVTYPKVYANPRTSCSRFTLLSIIVVFMLLFYFTNNWSHPFVSNFEQQRFLFHQQQYELNRQAVGLLGPQVSHVGAGELAQASAVGSHRKLPSLLTRPLKHTPESMRLITPDKIQAWFSKVAKASSWNRTCGTSSFWQSHHQESNEGRIKRVRWMCNIYGFYDRIFTYWHRSSNRRADVRNARKYCSTLHCPLIVDDHYHTLTCFVQKVASTSIKQFYLYLNDNPNARNFSGWVDGQKIDNLTTFHQRANDELHRISPMFIPNIKDSSYFKALFVRHPFVRLVSAFKNKAETDPEVEPYFYAHYWRPMLDKLRDTRPKESNPERVTFREFVEQLLLQTDPYQYDEHWAPIWTRCEPCYMHYNFIGKLENSPDDFKNFKFQINENLVNLSIWENYNQQFGGPLTTDVANHSTSKDHSDHNELDGKQCQLVKKKYAQTVRYLAQLPVETLVKLYKIYYLDFELFGYTLEELFDAL